MKKKIRQTCNRPRGKYKVYTMLAFVLRTFEKLKNLLPEADLKSPPSIQFLFVLLITIYSIWLDAIGQKKLLSPSLVITRDTYNRDREKS
jgi:hypothetical protein